LAPDESRRRQSVQSVIKALRILAIFDVEHRHWKVGDIAKATGYDRTTVHRIVQTMEGERVLARVGQSGSYELGGGLATLLFMLDPFEQLRILVRPYLQDLADLTGETSVLGVECNLDTLILDFVLTRNAYKPFITHGRRWTGLGNAHAKVFCAFSSPERRAKMLQAIRAKAAPEAIAQVEAFESELAETLSAGVAMDLGGQTPGVHVVAGPVFSAGSDVVRIGLGVTAPPERGSREELQHLAGIVRRVCDQVSAEMGPDLYALLRQIRDDLL
jgi:DNA-binding IclR family transcriptional regulator